MKRGIGFVTIIIIIAAILALVWYLVWRNPGPTNNPSGGASTTTPAGQQDITYKNATNDLITVQLPYPQAVVGKEFSVIGKARGPWYFEASFPVEVLDRNGKSLATATATAQGEWMTNDFVPFRADLKVPQSYIGPATLILKNDNPSGDPSRDKSISFPINIEY